VTGQFSPSARLPITYPLASDGGGSPYFHTISDQCTKGEGILPHYEYAQCEVQWPFGHGLSYASFSYSNLAVSGNVVEGITVTAHVENKGAMAAAEAVMVFTFDDFRLSTPEYKRLRGVQKVWLEPNQLIHLEFTIPAEDFKFVGPHDDRHYILDPTMSFWVGIGPDTDCRADPTNQLCKHVEPATSASTNFSPSCQIACDLLMDRSHSCSSQIGLASTASCLSLCQDSSGRPMDWASVGMDGWGWNYVDCLESIVWGFQQQNQQQSAPPIDCSKLTRLCRDVFSTPQMNEFGLGGEGMVSSGQPPLSTSVPGASAPPGVFESADPSTPSKVFGLIALLVGTVAVMLAMRGISVLEIGRSRKHRQNQEDPDEHGNGVSTVEMFSMERKSNGRSDQGSTVLGALSAPSELLGRIEQHKRREFSAVATS